MSEQQIREVYLDNSATTKVCEPAVRAAVQVMQTDYGNAASLHRKGFEAEQHITAAKKSIAAVLGCTEQELYFTSGATESNNMSLIGAADANKRRGKKIITTAIEHASVLETAAYLERQGYEVVRLQPNADGQYTPMDFYNAVDEQTVLVSAMFVNNEIGCSLPVTDIAKAVKRKNPNALFHTDAVQGFLKLPLKLKNSGIDLLSASGHKIYAPKGIGLLYIRKGVHLTPLLYGGGQQNGVRVGTDNVPLIAALGAAVQMGALNMEKNLAHYRSLKAHLLNLLQDMPEITVNSTEDCVPYIVNLSVAKIRSEVMLHFLEQFGISVSSGSACSKGAKSHVLSAFGLDDRRIDTALRISFSTETTTADLDYFTEKLQQGIDTLAKMR